MQFRNLLNFFLCLFTINSVLATVPYLNDIFTLFSVSLFGMKLSEWLMTITRKYFLYKTVSPENKAVLITGCDTGFGNEFARRMDKLGYKVFAACLDSEGRGAKDLMMDCSEKLTVLPMDVTDDRSVREAKDFITRNLGQNDLWAVLNNAGIGHAGEIDWTPFEELQTVYDVNAAGTLRVIKAFLPFLKKSKGRIVNNNSLSGRHPCAGFVGYSMSKSAAIALTTGLRIELTKWGVKAISIEPFFYLTPLTSPKSISELVEKTWKNVPGDIKEEYGEQYKESFKKSISQCFSRHCSPRISDVIDCFEDAVTAEEPLSSYFPSEFRHKVAINLISELPSAIDECVQRYQLEKGVKPAALMPKKYNKD